MSTFSMGYRDRMKVPEVETGLWPAAWFLGGNHPEVGWPNLVKLI